MPSYHAKPTAAILATEPYVHVASHVLRSGVHAVADPRVIAKFTASWDDLPVDDHLVGDVAYRRRRYSSFTLDPRPLRRPHRPFFQSTQINPLHGGVPRSFAPLADDVAESPVLAALIHTTRRLLPGPLDTKSSACGVHQIRIETDGRSAGLPAPEGIHCDGHAYVAQVLIRRDEGVGGKSTIFDLDRRALYSTTLHEPFECLIVDDRRVLHGVTPFSRPGVRVVRDMLLIDFFRLPEPAASTNPVPAVGAARLKERP